MANEQRYSQMVGSTIKHPCYSITCKTLSNCIMFDMNLSLLLPDKLYIFE